MNTDELIDSGFESLRDRTPARDTYGLTTELRRRERRTRARQAISLTVACSAAGVVAAIALRPISALAALKESGRLTSAQPFVHLHMIGWDKPAAPTTPPWPAKPALDIWRFPDYYVRSEGHVLCELFRDGRTLARDDRFPIGFESSYDAARDSFWRFDGTVSLELATHRNPPIVHSADPIDFQFDDTDGLGNRTISHIYVDPATKLIRSAEDHRTSPDGSSGGGTSSVEYPSRLEAELGVPKFAPRLKWVRLSDLKGDLKSFMAHPEQAKSVGGVKVNLYAVIVHPNVPDGIGLDVITTGGAGPQIGSAHSVEVMDQKLLPVKKAQWFPVFADADHRSYGFRAVIDGREAIENQSEDLMEQAPTSVTVHVPVWGAFHTFVGYATFKTSRIIYNVSENGLEDSLIHPRRVP